VCAAYTPTSPANPQWAVSRIVGARCNCVAELGM